MSTYVDFVETGYPQLHIVFGGSQQNDFTVNLRSQALYGSQPIMLLDGTYQIRSLDDWFFGDFEWWRCVWPLDDECHIFISEEGNVYLPSPYRYQYQADYMYDEQNGHATYIVYALADTNEVVRIDFIPEPFE